MYYNLDSKTGKHIKRITFTSFVPLFAKIIDEARGKAMINRYLLSQDHLWSDYGIRSLSKSDPEYNNRNIMKSYSNWQGPLWPLVNYICMQILLNYGFQDNAIEVARKNSKLILEDIRISSGMHENYDAETGKPLAAGNKVSWNLLVANMLSEAIQNLNPFEIA